MTKVVGRPPAFSCLKEMTDKIEDYWKNVEKEGGEYYGHVPDVEGLCMHLDICRETLCEYEKKSEYSDTIKKAKNKVFYSKKQGAYTGKYNATVFIFDAKNNHNYEDKMTNNNNINHVNPVTLYLPTNGRENTKGESGEDKQEEANSQQ